MSTLNPPSSIEAKSPTSDKSRYVAEVDGLRAFAVAAVLLFHAFPRAFPGGFIGVDIFFTISGFVIARTYLDRLMSGATSLRRFFLRRIRRLAPAYTVVLIVSTVFALLLLDPPMLKKYGVSLLSQPFYLQNVTFWLEGDYFRSALSKPLLHTWSLAVEEQFYFLFGLVILILRWRKGLLWSLIVAGCILSFVVGLSLVTLSPKTAFYLVPFRVWEFGAGIVASLVSRNVKTRPAGYLEIAIFALASAGVVASVLAFGEAAAFPGLQSVVSTLSVAVLVILFDKRPSSVYAPLKVKLVRHIGELSYSLYLWHWPVLVFGAYVAGEALGLLPATMALVLSYLLSELTYRLVENPVRRKVRFSQTPSLLRGWALSSATLAAAGLFLVLSNGGLFRFEEPMRTIYAAALEPSPKRCNLLYRVSNPGAELCPMNDAADAGQAGVLLIGDSHAAVMKDALSLTADSLGTALWMTTRNCDLNEFGSKSYCSTDVLDAVLSQARDRDLRRVIAVSVWGNEAVMKDTKKYLAKTIWKIKDNGLDLYLANTVPTNPLFAPDSLITLASTSRLPTGIPRLLYEEQLVPFRDAVAWVQDSLGVDVSTISVSDNLCSSSICDAFTQKYPNYIDDGHLSSVGVRRVIGAYRPHLSLED